METATEYLIRAVCLSQNYVETTDYLLTSSQIFFGLNVLSNIIMWALFTRALTAASSATQVTITNTSANFLVTALLGMMVFSERVAPLWWLGATIMAAGCIIVGMREDGKSQDGTTAIVREDESELASVAGDEADDLVQFRDEEDLRQVN